MSRHIVVVHAAEWVVRMEYFGALLGVIYGIYGFADALVSLKEIVFDVPII